MKIHPSEEVSRSRHPRLRAVAKAATVLATVGFGAADPACADVTDADTKDGKKTVVETTRISFWSSRKGVNGS